GADLAAEEVPCLAERGGGGGEAVVGPAAVAFLLDEAAFLEEPQVARDAGLGDAEDGGQLAHVEPLLLEEPQDAQPGFVAEQAEEGGRFLHVRLDSLFFILYSRCRRRRAPNHISKYTYRYGVRQERRSPPASGRTKFHFPCTMSYGCGLSYPGAGGAGGYQGMPYATDGLVGKLALQKGMISA